VANLKETIPSLTGEMKNHKESQVIRCPYRNWKSGPPKMQATN